MGSTNCRVVGVVVGRKPSQEEIGEVEIKALIEGLKQRNSGLCIATLRDSLAEFQDEDRVEVAELERLPESTAVRVLVDLGVGSYEEQAVPFMPVEEKRRFEAVVKELGGHPLSLSLLGKNLVTYHKSKVCNPKKLIKYNSSHGSLKEPKPCYKVLRYIEKSLTKKIEKRKKLDRPLATSAGEAVGCLILLGIV